MNKLLNKFFSPNEIILFGKDFGYFWRFGLSRAVLLLSALALSFILPMIYYLFALTSGNDFSIIVNQDAPYLMGFTGATLGEVNYFYFANLLMNLFFILIPIISSGILTAVLFTGERENKTSTMLLNSFDGLKSIFKTKIICVCVTSMLVTIISFLIILVFITIVGMNMGVLENWNVIYCIEQIVIAPLLIFMTALVTFYFSNKYRYVIQSAMSSGYVATPIILFYIGQLMGLYYVDWIFLLVAIVIMIALDILFYKFVVNRLTTDKFI